MTLSGSFSNPKSPKTEPSSLIDEVERLRARSHTQQSSSSAIDLVAFVMESVGEEHDATVGMRIGTPVARLIKRLLEAEPFALDPLAAAEELGPSAAAGVAFRNQL